jgi:hypothetical protein
MARAATPEEFRPRIAVASSEYPGAAGRGHLCCHASATPQIKVVRACRHARAFQQRLGNRAVRALLILARALGGQEGFSHTRLPMI